MEKVAELRKSAEKMSQLIRRPSQESITSDSSPIPPFKPIPKITLQRSSSLPRIEVERPSTPASAPASAPAGLVTSKPQQHDYSLGQNIPPNAKKLRVRSFLWVKPSVAGMDTSIYSQVQQARLHRPVLLQRKGQTRAPAHCNKASLVAAARRKSDPAALNYLHCYDPPDQPHNLATDRPAREGRLLARCETLLAPSAAPPVQTSSGPAPHNLEQVQYSSLQLTKQWPVASGSRHFH